METELDSVTWDWVAAEKRESDREVQRETGEQPGGKQPPAQCHPRGAVYSSEVKAKSHTSIMRMGTLTA